MRISILNFSLYEFYKEEPSSKQKEEEGSTVKHKPPKVHKVSRIHHEIFMECNFILWKNEKMEMKYSTILKTILIQFLDKII